MTFKVKKKRTGDNIVLETEIQLYLNMSKPNRCLVEAHELWGTGGGYIAAPYLY